MASSNLILPNTIIGPADIGRLKRELTVLDDQLHQADLRARAAGGKKTAETVKPKRSLTSLAELNDCDLHDRGQRQALVANLEQLMETAPTITISFAVDPSETFMAQIVDWFRTNTHPAVLIRVGLQPSIAAGCRLRTPGKVYDFSLRGKFQEQRPMLVKRLRDSAQRPVTSIQAPTVGAPI